MEFLKLLPTRGIITSPAFNFESTPSNKTYVSLKDDAQNGKAPQHLQACDSAFILAKALASQNIHCDNSQNQVQAAKTAAGPSKTSRGQGQGQRQGLEQKSGQEQGLLQGQGQGQGQGQTAQGQGENGQQGKGSGKRKNGDNKSNSKKVKKNPDLTGGQRRSKRKQNETSQNQNQFEDCDGPSSSKRPRRGVQNRCSMEEIVEGQDESIRGGQQEEEEIIYTEAQLQAKTNKELQDILKCMGQGVRGRKHELIQRILQAQMAE